MKHPIIKLMMLSSFITTLVAAYKYTYLYYFVSASQINQLFMEIQTLGISLTVVAYYLLTLSERVRVIEVDA
jgi:hypothetical protein